MNNHKHCPECDSINTEVVHTEWFSDMVERVRICNECPTEWTVSYGNPHIVDVEQYD